VLLSGAVFTWYQYSDSKELNHRIRQQTAERERESPLWSAEVETTDRLFHVVGELATADASARPSIEAQFWDVYNGELPLRVPSGHPATAFANEIASCLRRECVGSELASLSRKYGPLVQADRARRSDTYRDMTEHPSTRVE
jgi:hypothetical protein